MGRRVKRGGEGVNNIGSYPHLLGMFFTGFTLMNTSVCAWQQHSDAFREHSSVFRDIFSALNYPRPMCPSTCCAVSPSLLFLVTLPCGQWICIERLLSTFPHFGCFSVSSRGSPGKTEGWKGKPQRQFCSLLPHCCSQCQLTSSGPGVPNRSVRSLATQLEVSGGQNQNHPCLPPFVGKLSSMKPVCSQNVGDLSYGIEQRIWGPPQAS